MKSSYLILISLLVSWSALAQKESMPMKKFEDQLPQAGRGNATVAYLQKSIDRMVYEFMEKEGIPGLTMAIVQAPYISRIVGYGVTDIEEGKLATVKTLWPIGPISQGFAAVAVVQLYERGKLGIQDPLGKYLKDIPTEWKEITLYQLMQHSSGIADYRNQQGFVEAHEYTPAQLLGMVRNLPLAFQPGTDIKQSATNFLLLTEVIEKVSKMSYSEFVKKNQVDYLGLKQTYFGEELGKVKQEDVTESAYIHELFKKDKEYIDPSETSTGYREVDGHLVKVASSDFKTLKGFSDLWVSAENVSHWDIALAGNALIAKPENRELVYKPSRLVNGKIVPAMAGWQFYNHKGLMDIKGNVPGHSVFLSRFTDASELVCVTLLANKEGVDLTNLARRIAAAFDEKLGSGVNDHLLYTYESQFSVEETIDRIRHQLDALHVPVFALFDHAKNAEEVGLTLRPTQVIVFGSPKVGTNLMVENPSIAIELPLKIAVWEDRHGSTWMAFPWMKQLGAEYSMENNPIINGMQTLLENIVRKSASVF